MNIAICDDNKLIREQISNLVKSKIPDAKIFPFKTKEDLLTSKEEFAIYLLDVKGIGGIDAAKILRKRQDLLNAPKSILIFVTGYSDYMSEAFDVHAFHYLLKPIDAQKFSNVLSQALSEIQTIKHQAEDFLLVKVDGVIKKIFLQDILYIESQNKKVVIHTSDKTFEVYGKMDAYELALNEKFFRCHRCYLVNFAKISAYNSGTIQLCNGDKIFISAKKFPSFVKNFLQYAQNGGLVNV